MKQLGWTECDVVELEVDDLKATALGIALNRTAELAEWDEPVLAKLLEELRSAGRARRRRVLARPRSTSCSPRSTRRPAATSTTTGPEPPPVDPVSRSGDLWMLGDHRLLCGDSTKAEDLARVMAGEKAALLSTDPPYCVDYTGMDRPIHDGKPSGKDWSPRLPRGRHQGPGRSSSTACSRRSSRTSRDDAGDLRLARARPAAGHRRRRSRSTGSCSTRSSCWVKPTRHVRPQLLPLEARAVRVRMEAGQQARSTGSASSTRSGRSTGRARPASSGTSIRPRSPRASSRSRWSRTRSPARSCSSPSRDRAARSSPPRSSGVVAARSRSSPRSSTSRSGAGRRRRASDATLDGKTYAEVAAERGKPIGGCLMGARKIPADAFDVLLRPRPEPELRGGRARSSASRSERSSRTRQARGLAGRASRRSRRRPSEAADQKAAETLSER